MLFGSIPELLQDVRREQAPDDMALVIEQAIESGYANFFETILAALPWRPVPLNGVEYPKPTAMGAQSAIVIGPDGKDEPNGPDELHCDRQGRVRIRFHWQDTGNASCWVRVAQRAAGGGTGCQFLPRVGQEVLVQFLENDIDQPIIVGALYNGRGEGGIVPTPGGRTDIANDGASFTRANDHMACTQGNLAGGHSPLWHGASCDSSGHRNAAAQWGMRSKEFGGSGYNQLLFDDTDAKGRVQLRCTHVATELSLGHIAHSTGNYRGSVRGCGAELRTDAYGTVHAAGLLVTSYTVAHTRASRDPVGENTPALAVLRQGAALTTSLDAVATAHQAVGLASHQGGARADASVLDKVSAPLKAMLGSLSGTVGRDGLVCANKGVGAGEGKLPHSRDPLMTLAAREGVSANAGQGLQLANGEVLAAISGQDAQIVSGSQVRLHASQAIGLLAGAIETGDRSTGMKLIATKDATDIQAQADGMAVQARDELSVVCVGGRVDFAAAKRISLSTAGGASITIESGNITFQCPGKLTAHAGKKSFTDPAKLGFDMPALPHGVCIACLKKSLAAGPAFTMVE